ncbi:MAG: UPF0280 family protein [Desulfonatronovibrionaceae bacterium]
MSKKATPEFTGTDRFYRGMCRPEKGEVHFQVVLEETDLWVTALKDLSAEILEYIHTLRAELKNHCRRHPDFLSALHPLDPGPADPEIAARMKEASSRLNIGPMAAVAGCIAMMVAERFADKSPDLVVENGGDIYMYSTRERKVGLLADPETGVHLALRVPFSQFPCSLCSSSSTIGHSLSLGQGDLVTVLAKDGCLADAAATALANNLQGKKGLSRMLTQAKTLKKNGVMGVFGQKGEEIGVWGEMELVSIPDDPQSP